MCASPINDVYSLLGLPITTILLLFTLNLPLHSHSLTHVLCHAWYPAIFIRTDFSFLIGPDWLALVVHGSECIYAHLEHITLVLLKAIVCNRCRAFINRIFSIVHWFFFLFFFFKQWQKNLKVLCHFERLKQWERECVAVSSAARERSPEVISKAEKSLAKSSHTHYRDVLYFR